MSAWGIREYTLNASTTEEEKIPASVSGRGWISKQRHFFSDKSDGSGTLAKRK
jgi:hypothetical protein